jgi:hypothetical protein
MLKTPVRKYVSGKIQLQSEELAAHRDNIIRACADGSISALGRRIHDDGDDRRGLPGLTPIPPGDWEGATVNWDDGSMSLDYDDSSWWVDIVIDRRQFEAHFVCDDSGKPPVNRGGRLPQPHWDAFWIEVCKYIDLNGIQSQHEKRALVDHMENWFIGKVTDYDVNRRTIEKKIDELVKVLLDI